MVSWSPEASSQNNGACSGTPPRTLHLGQVFHRFCTPIRSPCFGGHEKLITPLRSSVRGLENPIRQPRFGLPVPLVLYHRPGCGSALRPSVSSRRVSSSSPGRTISSQSSPCLSALRRTAAFPSGVLGPVLLRAFWRFAAAFLALEIRSHPSGLSLQCRADCTRTRPASKDPAGTLVAAPSGSFASSQYRRAGMASGPEGSAVVG
jgi:hypothetical protein